MKKLITTCAVIGLLISLQAFGASSVVFDRGLPTINLNNAAGANRSNVTWATTNPNGFIGDDFVIGTVGQSYVIDSITVWGAQYNPLSDDIDNIGLYVGKAGGSLALLSAGSVTGNTNSNLNISHTYLTYADGTGYQGNSGSFYPICQTTFSGLNYAVDGGVKYNFGVNGDKYLWWSHASNAALSGSPQDGADGKYLEFDTTNLSSVVVWDSSVVGWDKSSDINVQVNATQVPVPGAILLGGIGISLVGWLRRRRTL